MAKTPPSLEVQFGPLRLKNPVVIASGPWGYGEEWKGLAPWEELGALVLKTITLLPSKGNPPRHRTVETPGGMLNSIGLENVGLEVFLAEKLPLAKTYDTHIIASIGGESVEEFVEIASALDKAGVSALEINISCPNIKAGGMCFGIDPKMAAEVTSEIKKKTRLPIIPKLTPNVTDIAAIARACELAGADAIALVNTFSGMAIDIHTRRPLLGANFGGLSGAAIRPAALLRVYQVARAVKIPILGMGGILTPEDALEFLIAGASAIGIGTALFYDPLAAHKIRDGISAHLQQHNFSSVNEIISSLELNPT